VLGGLIASAERKMADGDGIASESSFIFKRKTTTGYRQQFEQVQVVFNNKSHSCKTRQRNAKNGLAGLNRISIGTKKEGWWSVGRSVGRLSALGDAEARTK
jgi:hypothetical protein